MGTLSILYKDYGNEKEVGPVCPNIPVGGTGTFCTQIIAPVSFSVPSCYTQIGKCPDGTPQGCGFLFWFVRKYEILLSGQHVAKNLDIYENENVGNYCIQAKDDVEATAWYGCGCPCPPGQTCPAAVVVLPFDLDYNVPIRECVIDSVTPSSVPINCNSVPTDNASVNSITLKDKIKIGNDELVFEKCLLNRKPTWSRTLPDTKTTGVLEFNQGVGYYVIAFYKRVRPTVIIPGPLAIEIATLVDMLKPCPSHLWNCYKLSERISGFPIPPALDITRCTCDFKLISTRIASMKKYLKSLDIPRDRVKLFEDVVKTITNAEDNVLNASELLDSIGKGKLTNEKKEKARQAIRLLDGAISLIRNAADKGSSIYSLTER